MHKYIMILCTGLLVFRRIHCAELCKPKVAIIGGGIGGASASHFLTELFDGNVDIDLFEANKIGGRLTTIEIDGRNYEAGGSVIHTRNEYMKYFLELLGMEQRPSGPDQKVGIWNGSKFVFKESEWSAITFGKLIYRYGLQPFKLFKYIQSIMDDFEKIYKLQKDHIAFNNINDLLKAMNDEFPKLLHISTKEHFENLGFSSEVIEELIQATLVVNYGQEINVHSFVGCISIAGADSNLWSVKGGNKEIPVHLIRRNEKITVIPSQVEKIRKLSNNISSQYEVFYQGSIHKMSSVYDIVIIATPLTKDHEMPIVFEDFPENVDLTFPGRYQTTVATFLKGDFQPYHFSLKDDNINCILSCNPNKTRISSLGKLSSVDGSFNKTGPFVWKIFSREMLSLPYLNRIFSHVSHLNEKVWKAYPHYTTKVRNDKFVLHDSLYHVNAIEWIASAMEISAIGGRNVAVLAYNDFIQKCGLSKTKQYERHSEL